MSFSRPSRWLVAPAALVAALTIAAGTPRSVTAQATIDTYTGWNGVSSVGYLGADGIVIGQTFSAPAQYLNSWTFWLRDYAGGAGTMLTANIGTWTGSAVGSVLWTSAAVAGTSSTAFVPYLFNTGGVSLLTGGELYVFYLSPVSGTGSMWMGYADLYAGGAYQANTSFQDPTDPWTFPNAFTNDLVFIAEFDRVPDSTVPEPATMTLLATGLAGMAAARRKKRRA